MRNICRKKKSPESKSIPPAPPFPLHGNILGTLRSRVQGNEYLQSLVEDVTWSDTFQMVLNDFMYGLDIMITDTSDNVLRDILKLIFGVIYSISLAIWIEPYYVVTAGVAISTVSTMASFLSVFILGAFETVIQNIDSYRGIGKREKLEYKRIVKEMEEALLNEILKQMKFDIQINAAQARGSRNARSIRDIFNEREDYLKKTGLPTNLKSIILTQSDLKERPEEEKWKNIDFVQFDDLLKESKRSITKERRDVTRKAMTARGRHRVVRNYLQNPPSLAPSTAIEPIGSVPTLSSIAMHRLSYLPRKDYSAAERTLRSIFDSGRTM